MKILTICLSIALIVGSFAIQASAGERLRKAEVQKIFIGKPWRGPTGTFHFQSSGTYTFRRAGKLLGPWKYILKTDGTIRDLDNSLHYRFFRTKRGTYQYWYSRTGRKHIAVVR